MNRIGRCGYTDKEIIKEASKKYNGRVSIDYIDDALQAYTLEEAIAILIDDSAGYNPKQENNFRQITSNILIIIGSIVLVCWLLRVL